MESTVVDISIHPPSFKPASLSLSRISSILKHPNKSFFNVYKYILTLLHTLFYYYQSILLLSIYSTIFNLLFSFMFNVNILLFTGYKSSKTYSTKYGDQPFAVRYDRWKTIRFGSFVGLVASQ